MTTTLRFLLFIFAAGLLHAADRETAYVKILFDGKTATLKKNNTWTCAEGVDPGHQLPARSGTWTSNLDSAMFTLFGVVDGTKQAIVQLDNLSFGETKTAATGHAQSLDMNVNDPDGTWTLAATDP